jgi:glycine/D-amino acid oxidase-like deaminating enzyme
MPRHTVIVGAGIAGLVTAERCARAGDRVTVIEKYDYVGGRVLTSKRGYEIGAGRVAGSHRHVWSLVRRFGLHRYRMSSVVNWRAQGSFTQHNPFDDQLPAVLAAIDRLPPHIKSSHTLGQLLNASASPIEQLQFPYRAEMGRLRADLSIESFHSEFSKKEQFFGVTEGLSTIIKGLETACRAAGVRFILNTTVTDVTADAVLIKGRAPIKADRVVLALHHTALAGLPCMRRAPFMQYLTMAPLTRIYAQYPTPAWFDSHRVVTDSPLRYLIPINPKTGVIMISYIDDQDTKFWSGLKGDALTTAIQKEVRRLYPDREIPEPLWCKAYEWTEGCTYWKPGHYDPGCMSRSAMQPLPATLPNLYVTGESVSMRQAWMEGALEHADALWHTYLKN